MADFFDGVTNLTRIHKWYLDLAEYIKKNYRWRFYSRKIIKILFISR